MSIVNHKIVAEYCLHKTRLAVLGAALAFGSGITSAAGQDPGVLREPPVFESSGGVLDLLMVARSNTNLILGLNKPVGWVYEICKRSSGSATRCPAGTPVSAEYGGTRLALQPGDKLRIRLVNKLPPIPEAKHAQDVSLDLALNPTNLHTHGLIVEPRYPTVARPTWGDNIFVLGFNPANGLPQPFMRGLHAHGSSTIDPIEYEIDIPANHPSGQFWFHPHIHGIALNQVSAGLAGIISIGKVSDYVCEDAACQRPWAPQNVRHLILKDIQVDASGLLQTQQDPQFCTEFPAATDGARKGSCTGQAVPGGDSHIGGHWIFSVNGQVYPAIPISSPAGELWRITNASGSNSYDLSLWNPDLQQNAAFQVVSVDGVSIDPAASATPSQLGVAAGTKIRTIACPASAPIQTQILAPALCATGVRMMPSSRVEIRVVYRNANGRAALPPVGAKLVLRTTGFETGGDNWPAVDLAEVHFATGASALAANETATVRGQAAAVHSFGGTFAPGPRSFALASQPANCKRPLAARHHRRIYYGVPTANPNGFGLGYEEIDQFGVAVPGTFVDITPFDPQNSIICLPLGPGNTAVVETWELINVSPEDHNFHIHQTKFRVLSAQSMPPTLRRTMVAGSATTSLLPFPKAAVLLDNMPLPSDPSCDGSIKSWQYGTCLAKPALVEIAFSQVGDFVYHCHILEHEDGGMMAKITVIGRP